MTDMYKEASKLNLTFETSRGQLSVSDLWNLPLNSSKSDFSLNGIAKSVYSKIKETEVLIDFVDEKTQSDKILELKLKILKDIIQDKKDENRIKVANMEKAQLRQKINEAISRKKDNEFNDLSIEQLEAKLKEI